MIVKTKSGVGALRENSSSDKPSEHVTLAAAVFYLCTATLRSYLPPCSLTMHYAFVTIRLQEASLVKDGV